MIHVAARCQMNRRAAIAITRKKKESYLSTLHDHLHFLPPTIVPSSNPSQKLFPPKWSLVNAPNLPPFPPPPPPKKKMETRKAKREGRREDKTVKVETDGSLLCLNLSMSKLLKLRLLRAWPVNKGANGLNINFLKDIMFFILIIPMLDTSQVVFHVHTHAKEALEWNVLTFLQMIYCS